MRGEICSAFKSVKHCKLDFYWLQFLNVVFLQIFYSLCGSLWNEIELSKKSFGIFVGVISFLLKNVFFLILSIWKALYNHWLKGRRIHRKISLCLCCNCQFWNLFTKKCGSGCTCTSVSTQHKVYYITEVKLSKDTTGRFHSIISQLCGFIFTLLFATKFFKSYLDSFHFKVVLNDDLLQEYIYR